MPRIYRMDQREENKEESDFVLRILRIEILVGAILTMVGGFMLRTSKDYSLIVVGLTLLMLGTIRLWRRYSPNSKESVLIDDRVLRKLQLHLDSDYTVVKDYDINGGEKIPYLLLGPPGVILLTTWDRKGTVTTTSKMADTLEVVEPSSGDDGDSETLAVPNPFLQQTERRQQLEELLRTEDLGSVPIQEFVVLLTHNVEGELLKSDNVVSLRDLVERISVPEPEAVNWETVDELERVLSLRD